MTKLMTLLIAACFLVPLTIAQDNSAQDSNAGEKISKYVYWQDAKVNPGKFDVFARQVAQIREAANTNSPDAYWIAGTPITGDGGMVTFVTFHDSMASVEKFDASLGKTMMAAMKNANLSAEAAESEGPARSGVAEYSEELSYRPTMVPMAQTAWWEVEVLGLRPGCDREFNAAAKQVIELHKKANDNEHWVGYKVLAGFPIPSIVFVKPMRSLAEEDEQPPAAAKELFESPLVQRLFETVGKECITHIERNYTKVSPSLSRAPQSMVAANPSFWNLKEAEATSMPAKGKKAKMKTTAAKSMN
jgi:hypothetical protein